MGHRNIWTFVGHLVALTFLPLAQRLCVCISIYMCLNFNFVWRSRTFKISKSLWICQKIVYESDREQRFRWRSHLWFFFYFPCSLLFFGLFFRRYIYTNVLYSFPTSDVISDDRVLRLKKLICLCDRKFEYEFGR